MAFDVNIVKFTGGTHQGEYGILIDRKLQVFVLYDQRGNFLNTWGDDEIYGEEIASGNEGYEPSPLDLWLEAHPYRFWGTDAEDEGGLPASILRALARVAIAMSEQVNQTAICLPDNICCIASRGAREMK